MLLLKNNNILAFLISLTLFSLPLYLLRCNSSSVCRSGVPFTFLELLILVTFFYWFFLKFKKKRNIPKIITEIRTKIPLLLQIFFVVFLFSALINILFSSDKISAAGFYKAYFVEPFLFFLVILDYLNEKGNFKLIFWSFLSSGLWISLLSLIEKIFNFSPFNSVEYLIRGRVGAVYQTSNSIGLLLGPLVIVLIGYFFYLKKEENAKVLFGMGEIKWAVGSLFLFLAGLYSSGSRGAWLGVIASCLLFFGFILYKKITEKKLVNILKKFFLASTTLFFILNVLFLFNINSFIVASNKSTFFTQISPRLCLWEAAVNIIKEKPIIGSGLGGFSKDNNYHHTCSQEKTTYPHNIFLNFWVETGIFGLLSFVSICGWFFFNLLGNKKLNFLKLGLAGFFVSILFHGLVDVPYLKNDLSVLFWVVIALSLYLINQDNLFVVKSIRVGQRRFRR